jgi:hypothetical protein
MAINAEELKQVIKDYLLTVDDKLPYMENCTQRDVATGELTAFYKHVTGSEDCCLFEQRDINGGCTNCGDPCY